jgi:phosphatidylinositol alpha-1,6-mannosyltransferase
MANREINGDTEGFGMVFLEAAACGKPAIAGDAGGTGAAVVDGVTGYRVDGTNVSVLVDRLSALLGNPDLAAQLGQAGLVRARDEFSWDAVAYKTRGLL